MKPLNASDSLGLPPTTGRQIKRLEHIQDELKRITTPLRIAYISTSVPRRCGIATFTHDLSKAMNLLNPTYPAQYIALDNDISKKLTYSRDVKVRIRENEWVDYQNVIDYLNSPSGPEVISLQHEYGIFGKNAGKFAALLTDLVDKPVVTTFHTILTDPSRLKREIVSRISDQSAFVVVMLALAASILENKYQVDPKKIVVIPHGVPDFPRLHPREWKTQLGLNDRVVMTSTNLLSPTKGIEYAVGSLPEITKVIPNFLYLVIGQTHPVYLTETGRQDLYRQRLRDLAKQLGVQQHVRFIKRYVSLKELVNYIGASDFYVTPYLDPQQSASGSLSHAIGGGKVCISTPYLYAGEVLSRGRGILVPFRDSHAISQAVVRLAKNPKRLQEYERRAWQFGRSMTWVNVAHQYYHLFNTAVHGPIG